MDTVEINPDVRERILAAARDLYEHSGRQGFPTLDAVRKRSRTNMADASAVMKEWRRSQTAQPSTAPPSVPDRVQHAAQAAIAALWADAKEVAAESLQSAEAAWAAERAESDADRRELSAAFDAQGAEFESLRAELTQVTRAATAAAAARDQEREDSQARLAALTAAAQTATVRAEELTARAADLKDALEGTQVSLHTQAAELHQEREQHAHLRARFDALILEHARTEAQVAELSAAREEAHAARTRIEALTAELATCKARIDVHQELAERLQHAETQLTEVRAGAAAAREDAAHLRGQAGTLSQQNAELLQALKFRDARG